MNRKELEKRIFNCEKLNYDEAIILEQFMKYEYMSKSELETYVARYYNGDNFGNDFNSAFFHLIQLGIVTYDCCGMYVVRDRDIIAFLNNNTLTKDEAQLLRALQNWSDYNKGGKKGWFIVANTTLNKYNGIDLQMISHKRGNLVKKGYIGHMQTKDEKGLVHNVYKILKRIA